MMTATQSLLYEILSGTVFLGFTPAFGSSQNKLSTNLLESTTIFPGSRFIYKIRYNWIHVHLINLLIHYLATP